MKVSKAIITTLENLGIKFAFGIPGGPVSPIFNALTESVISLIQTRHESGAAFSAIGYYEQSGKIPCVIVTAGPGATNVITGIAAAYAEHIPMVVIVGDVSWSSGKVLVQNSGPEGIDVQKMFGPITKNIFRIINPNSAVPLTVAAYNEAKNKQGPVVLIVPIETAFANCKETQVVSIAPTIDYYNQPYLSYIINKLKTAKHPLIVIGAGCRQSKFIQQFIEYIQVPFITTPRAKGIITENHSCSLRNGGLAASQWARKYCELGIDCALVLGTDLDDCSIGSTKYITDDGTLIHVDLNPQVFGRNLPTSLGIVCDIDQLLMHSYNNVTIGIKQEVLDIKTQSPFDIPNFEYSKEEIITPYRAIADLQFALKDAKFVTDIGEHMLFALHYLTSTNPLTIHLGLGSMGSGICSSIGMSLGTNKKDTIVCICGDGGMQMYGMEVCTAKKLNLPILFAVFNDSRYNMVHHGFKQVYNKTLDVESIPVDFKEFGKSIGVPAEIIHHPGEIIPSLVYTLLENGPAILDIRIDREIRMVGGGRNESLQKMSQPE